MLDYILAHPLYIPFLILNIFIIYKVIKIYVCEDQGNNDDDDGGIPDNDDPVLDLPPGVGSPKKIASLKD
ncbi:MAG: hypothetical protein EA341_16690 [Mongoliibacter sp.]|jgi:hypothetical protein|uniref:hypothetical protein n=1 Tax=Mongoliibacter sp. TaxID=2022438 RepID=UPI0012F3C80B|nr:hypothetical protein [Mongoliibacter sp.]TVP44484.1 MAG: hypothetical protein EA341_16690 [Mongoliibacter sp.]